MSHTGRPSRTNSSKPGPLPFCHGPSSAPSRWFLTRNDDKSKLIKCFKLFSTTAENMFGRRLMRFLVDLLCEQGACTCCSSLLCVCVYSVFILLYTPYCVHHCRLWILIQRQSFGIAVSPRGAETMRSLSAVLIPNMKTRCGLFFKGKS